jgi:alpha-tubulin suppressor-like RCC1 family protein
VSIAGVPLSNVVAVAAGYFHALALESPGTVMGWGFNHFGLVTGSPTSDQYTTNGLVVVGGALLTNVTAVAAANFSLALRRDGTIVAFGDNRIPSGLSNVVAIAAGGFYSLALKRDGTVVGWQSRPWAETEIPVGLSNVVAIATGDGDYERSMALRKNGSVVLWSSGVPREKPVPAEVTNAVAIAAGSGHSLALKSDGTVVEWGDSSGALVTVGGRVLSNVTAISAASEYSLALKRDGNVVAWGNPKAYRDVPAGLRGVVAIAAGKEFCLAITTNTAPFRLK